jgi:hypothetical protein
MNNIPLFKEALRDWTGDDDHNFYLYEFTRRAVCVNLIRDRNGRHLENQVSQEYVYLRESAFLIFLKITVVY